MDEVIRQVLAILRAMWKHRRLGVFVAWAVGILGAGIVMRIPDKYEASARVYVDTQSILKPLMAGLTVQPNIDQQVMMLSRTLISRPNVEKVVRMADLDLDSKSKTAQDELVERLLRTLAIKSTTRDNLYSVVYVDSKPEQAKKVVQSLVSIFVESSLGDKRKDSDSAKRFIEDQIRTYEKKLEEAENRVKEFKLRNIELQLDDGRSSPDRLGDIAAKLSAARLELREAENSRDALKRQVVGEEPVLLPDSSASVADVSVPEIDGRINDLKRNLDGLLQKYTEQHPDVVGTRRVIKDLEDQKRKDIAGRKKAGGGSASAPVSGNPVYQQLRVTLAESEANVASLRARVGEYEARYARSRELMKTMPQIEAEFAQLNRDYAVHKNNYQSLVSRRESATLSGDLEAAAGVADFRLIDPPRVSPQPVAPNRLLLLAMALAASIGAGVVAAFLASQIRPVFLDGKSLRDVTGLPLLGTVSMVVSESMRMRERQSVRRVLLALGGLVAAYGAGIGFLFLATARGA